MSASEVLKCRFCGGDIDPTTYRCRYCGTQYKIPEYLNNMPVMKLTVEKPGLRVFQAQVLLDEYELELMHFDKEYIEYKVNYEMCRQFVETLVKENLIEIEYCDDYDCGRPVKRVRARFRVAEPSTKF